MGATFTNYWCRSCGTNGHFWLSESDTIVNQACSLTLGSPPRSLGHFHRRYKTT